MIRFEPPSPHGSTGPISTAQVKDRIQKMQQIPEAVERTGRRVDELAHLVKESMARNEKIHSSFVASIWKERANNLQASSKDSFADLPEGWTVHFDAKRNRNFFHHRETDKSQWDRPTLGAPARTGGAASATQEEPANGGAPVETEEGGDAAT